MAVFDSSITRWVALIQAEYREIPGLQLTRPQFQRLWSLDAATCSAVLDALEAAKFLRRTSRDAYVRMNAGF